MVAQTDQCFLRCIFAVDRNYGCDAGRFDTVMDDANEEHYLAQSCKKNTVLWLARGTLFLRVSKDIDDGIERSSHNNMSRKNCGLIHKSEMTFVQSYNILDEKKLCGDGIDKTVGCIRPKQQRTKRRAGGLFSADEYELIPDGSTRDFVHLVERNIAFALLDESHLRKQGTELL